MENVKCAEYDIWGRHEILSGHKASLFFFFRNGGLYWNSTFASFQVLKRLSSGQQPGEPVLERPWNNCACDPTYEPPHLDCWSCLVYLVTSQYSNRVQSPVYVVTESHESPSTQRTPSMNRRCRPGSTSSRTAMSTSTSGQGFGCTGLPKP